MDNFSLRTYDSLAKELKLSGRQFARRLDRGDPKACLVMRQEIFRVWHEDVRGTCADLETFGRMFRKCDPKVSAALLRLAHGLVALMNATPMSDYDPDPGEIELPEPLEGDAWDSLAVDVPDNLKASGEAGSPGADLPQVGEPGRASATE